MSSYGDPFGLFDCSLKNWRDCKFGSVTARLGPSPLEFKGTLLGARIDGKIGIRAGVDAKVTAGANGVTADVSGKAQLTGKLSTTLGRFGVSINGSCGLSSDGACSGSVKAGPHAGAPNVSNTSVGAETGFGLGKLGVEVDVVQSATIIAGSTWELLTDVAGAAYNAVTNPNAEQAAFRVHP